MGLWPLLSLLRRWLFHPKTARKMYCQVRKVSPRPLPCFLEINPKASLLLAMLQLGELEPSAGDKNVGES